MNQQPSQDPKALGAVQQWKICDLKTHPKQHHFFPDESLKSDRELEADMQAQGQLQPIDILPDGTILGGHRRTKAAKQLGWTTLKAIVHDLDEEEAEAFLIGDNYNRRQLSAVQKVRCAVHRVESAKSDKVALPPECDSANTTRDKIGELLGLSGRHVDRYLRAFKAPTEVQNALDAGHLNLKEAGQVAELEKKVQQDIAEEIRKKGMAEARAIVKKHLPAKAETQPDAASFWRGFQWAMREAIANLPGRVDELTWMTQADVELIESAEALLAELKKRAIQCIKNAEEDARWDPDELAQDEQIRGVPTRDGGHDVHRA